MLLGEKKRAPSNTVRETEREISRRLDKNSFMDLCHRKVRNSS
jgi:hypothetical protein